MSNSWGESAGAISVALQMLTNGGNTSGLFHGAFMQSGAPIPVGDISRGQTEYDQLVQDTSCGNATDTLECLRALPYDTLKQAVDQSPGIISYQVRETTFWTDTFVPDHSQSLRLSWLPRVDGRFLTDTPQNLVLQGSIATIPHVSGVSFSLLSSACFRALTCSQNVNDEGTVFSLVNSLTVLYVLRVAVRQFVHI